MRQDRNSMKTTPMWLLVLAAILALNIGSSSGVEAQPNSLEIDFINLVESGEHSQALLDALFAPYKQVALDRAWDAINRRSGLDLARVDIGIMDTGVDKLGGGHPEFESVVFSTPSIFSLSDDEPTGHGTQVAGIIGANNISFPNPSQYEYPQMNGILAGARSLPYRIDLPGRSINAISTHFGIANELDRLAQGGSEIINMSFGGLNLGGVFIYSRVVARNPDTLFVAASGNGIKIFGSTIGVNAETVIPGALGDNLDNVITVGAVDENDFRASFSNFGTPIALAAPGSGVYAPAPRGRGDSIITSNDYDEFFGGTSAAAPFVTGVAGLIKSINNNLAPAQIKQILIESADPIATGEPGRLLGAGCYDSNNNPNNYTGCRLNALAAVCHPLVLDCGPKTYDYATDYIRIDSNIPSVPGCTTDQNNQTVRFFDGFDDGSVTSGCTSNFGQFGTFTESDGFLRYRFDDGLLEGNPPAFSLRVHALWLTPQLNDGDGNSEIVVAFRPDVPPLGSQYTLALTQTSGDYSHLAFNVFTNSLGTTFSVFSDTSADGLQFRSAPAIFPETGPLLVRMQFDDAANEILLTYSIDEGATFIPFQNSDNTPFIAPFFPTPGGAEFNIAASQDILTTTMVQQSAFSQDAGFVPEFRIITIDRGENLPSLPMYILMP